MISFERQEKIMDYLKQHSCVTVTFLCEHLYASGATIRRDIAELYEKGLITRVRGGAALVEGRNQDPPLLVRQNTNREKKEYIVQLALKYIRDSTTLFFDSSSTVSYLARKLSSFHDISVVTNGLDTINILNEHTGAKIFSCGGLIRHNAAMTGNSAIETVKGFRADIFFFSCCGFSPDSGPTEAGEENAAIKKTMLENARKRVLLCDSTKFGRDFFCRICDTADIDVIITEQKPEEPFFDLLKYKAVYC